MASEIKVPGIGPVDKKYVYAGVAVVAGIAGYAWWISKRNAAADPLVSDYTGEAQEGTEYAGEYSYDSGVANYTGATGSQGPVYVDQNPLPSTNAEWAIQTVDKLTDVGYDALTVSSAIGKYMARLEMTEAQADVVRQAIALMGPPPSGDFTIKISAPNPVDPTPTDPSGSSLPGPTGLTSTGSTKTTVSLKWNPVPGADSYRAYRKGVGTNIGHSEDTMITLGGFQPNTSYTFHIRAIGKDGKYGAASSTKTVKTKK